MEFAFAPDDLGFIADPYPVYTQMREQTPIWYHEPTDHWLVSRFADVNALLRDRRFGRTYHHVATDAEMGRPEAPDWHGPFWHLIRSGILDMEPPDHTRVRALVSKAFTPRMVEGMRDRIQRMMDGLVDVVEGGGEFDLISTLAEPLPVAVIAELLGVPHADRGLLRPWSADICGMYELRPSEETARTAVRACVEFSDYLRTLSRERRADPRDDLISALAQVLDEGERLTEDELIGTCVLLLNAGHEATVNVTGNGWWSLFRNPDQLARLRDDATLGATGDRGADAVGHPAADVRAVGVGGLGDLRRSGSQGSRARTAVRVREPGSGGVRSTRRSRRRARSQPTRVVRRRRAFLLGGAARATGTRDVVLHGPSTLAQAAARRGAELEAELHHPGLAGTPRGRLSLTPGGSGQLVGVPSIGEPAVGFEPTT